MGTEKASVTGATAVVAAAAAAAAAVANFTRHGTALAGLNCAPRNVYETPVLAGSGK